MVHFSKRKDKKSQLFCPNCTNTDIIQYRHPSIGKIQYYCKSCKKYFSEDALKGYPPSNISFPIITYLLYFRRKVLEFSNMRKYRKFVNYWLKYLKVCDQEVSRQTIHHWINNYDKFLDRVISFSDSRNFVRQQISKIHAVPVRKPIPYGAALSILQKKFGKTYCVDLIRKDPVFFQDFVDIVSKHGVFGWEFLDSDFGGGSVSHQSLATG